MTAHQGWWRLWIVGTALGIMASAGWAAANPDLSVSLDPFKPNMGIETATFSSGEDSVFPERRTVASCVAGVVQILPMGKSISAGDGATLRALPNATCTSYAALGRSVAIAVSLSLATLIAAYMSMWVLTGFRSK